MSIDKPKRISSKYQPSLSPKQIEEKSKELFCRLSRQNICKQPNLIKHMNPKLQIKFQHFKKDPLFQKVKFQDILKILSKIQFLNKVQPYRKIAKGKSQQQKNNKKQAHQKIIQQQLTFKIQYLGMDRIILSTGITKQFIQEAVRQYNAQKHNHIFYQTAGKKHQTLAVSIIGSNQHWIAIQAVSSIQASFFKKFIRNKKREMDLQQNKTYKQEKKRVRIIMLNEDFYTLLVDAMSQKKSQIFASKLLSINQYNTMLYSKQPNIQNTYKGKINSIKETGSQAIYYKKQTFYIPIQTSSQHSNRNQIKDEDNLNNCYLNSTLDDFISQGLSKNSEAMDVKVQDLIQTTEQGIQAQNQTQFGGSQSQIQQKISCSNVFSSQCNKRQQFNNSENNQNINDQNEELIGKYLQLETALTCNQKIKDQSNQNLVNIISQTKKIQLKQSYLKEGSQIFPKNLSFLHQKQISTQTMLKYSQMKKYQIQFTKKAKGKCYMAPGVPQEFMQISDQMRYKDMFYTKITKKMQKMNQTKKMQWEQ